MNYDLCDLLNRKIEARCGYFDNMPSNSSSKNQSYADKFFEELDTDLYLETIDHLSADHQVYNFWLYRNGKMSKQIADFEASAKSVIRELANMTFSNNPSVDLMYFSAIDKIFIAKNKLIMIECCIRPSLDQMFAIKDLERTYLSENGVLIWKIVDRKNRNSYFEGIGSDKLHEFKWSKIK